MTNLPLTGKFEITAYFKQGGKHWKTLGFHTGMDFIGNTSIYATCDGAVDTITYSNSYGNYIIIKETNANRYHYFCHLSKVLVKKGQKVSRATILGIMGNTGNSTGVHLHYEIRKQKGNLVASNLVNPAEYCGIQNKKGKYNSADFQIVEKPNIKYEVHIQDIGWQEEKENGELAGTEGQALRIEAIKIFADIPIQYRVHIEGIGDTEWYKNGEVAGTTGKSLRIECIEIKAEREIKATAHIEGIGWSTSIVGKEIMIGTKGRALRLEALTLEFI